MKKTTTVPILPVATLLTLALAVAAPAVAADQASIKRGAFLVGVGGYVDCHTPFKMVANGPEMDFGRGLFRPPANPAPGYPTEARRRLELGRIGNDDRFRLPLGNQLRRPPRSGQGSGYRQLEGTGLHQGTAHRQPIGGGRPIMPPMPCQALGQLPTAEIKATTPI